MSDARDRIRLRGIAAEAVIGVYDFERGAARPLRIDVDMRFDARPSAHSDDVGDTIDYAAVTALLRRLCAEIQPALLEHLAEAMAQAVLRDFPVAEVRLALHKPGAVEAVDDIVVEITRSRSATAP